jgi:hypothetical protein
MNIGLGYIVESSEPYRWLVIKTRYLTMCSTEGPRHHVNGLCVLHIVQKLDIY